MWKQRLQQLGQRRSNKHPNNHHHPDHNNHSSRPRANTTPAPHPADDHTPSARDFPFPSLPRSESPKPILRRPMTTSEYPHPPPPTKASLKSWWNHFLFAQRAKKEAEEKKGESRVPPQSFIGSSAYRQGGTYSLNMPNTATGQNVVFGKPLKESLRYASVQISTANSNGELYVWGFIPVVVAKCGLYLKENGILASFSSIAYGLLTEVLRAATEVEGTFRVNGSNKRMRELQAAFEAPPRYGKNLDWKKEYYTSHDVASVFRRYLTQMPEPVIPNDMYHNFREALDRRPYSEDEVIATFKRLIRSLPRANQYLLLYVLDLLSVFARKSDKNLMTAKNLAVIFRPALLSHPSHELSPQEHQLSQDVLEFMIAHQDWFMLDIPPPPSATSKPGDAPVATTSGDGVDSSGDETNGGWKLVDTRKITRRRTTSERQGETAAAKPPSQSQPPLPGRVEVQELAPVPENPPSRSGSIGAPSMSRSRTLPSKARREGQQQQQQQQHPHHQQESSAGTGTDEERHAKLVKKGRRASHQTKRSAPPG